MTIHGSIVGVVKYTNPTSQGLLEDKRSGKRIKGQFSPDFKGALDNEKMEYRVILIECYLNEQRAPRLGLFFVLVDNDKGYYRRVGIFRSTSFLIDEHLFKVETTTVI